VFAVVKVAAGSRDVDKLLTTEVSRTMRMMSPTVLETKRVDNFELTVLERQRLKNIESRNSVQRPLGTLANIAELNTEVANELRGQGGQGDEGGREKGRNVEGGGEEQEEVVGGFEMMVVCLWMAEEMKCILRVQDHDPRRCLA